MKKGKRESNGKGGGTINSVHVCVKASLDGLGPFFFVKTGPHVPYESLLKSETRVLRCSGVEVFQGFQGFRRISGLGLGRNHPKCVRKFLLKVDFDESYF